MERCGKALGIIKPVMYARQPIRRIKHIGKGIAFQKDLTATELPLVKHTAVPLPFVFGKQDMGRRLFDKRISTLFCLKQKAETEKNDYTNA